MSRRSGATLALPLGAALLAAPVAHAQSILEPAARVAPTVVAYRFGGGEGGDVTQSVLPVAVVVPVRDRLTVDVATAWVHTVSRSGPGSSAISGLTDTQLRATWTGGADAVVLTAGLNLPTGRSAVRELELDAAGRFGNDFLGFPVSSLGDGLAMTMGVAATRPVGAWNVGGGVSGRRSSAFDAFELEAGAVRFRPASELRLRAGADRLVGEGRMSLGVTLSTFGRDAAGTTTYGAGDRLVVQGGWERPVGAATVLVDGWALRHAGGETALGAMPDELVASIGAAARWAVGEGAVEPHVELRDWRRDGSAAGSLAAVGVRGRLPLGGGVSLLPSIAATVGRLGAQPAAGTVASSVRGWQVSVALRR